MDKFPEAFRRFESVVNVNRIRSFYQLHLAFSSWAGYKWRGTSRQKYALAREAEERGFQVPLSYFRRPYKEVGWHIREFVSVDSFIRRGKEVYVLRDVKTGKFVSGKPDYELKAIGEMT